MSGSVPAQGQTLTGLGKEVKDLISEDTTINQYGAVTGTLKYIQDWSEFSDKPDEQSGHYFPVHIDDKYQGKEITCKGTTTKTAQDLDWVLLVKDTSSTFEFECEGRTILKLSFTGTTLAPNAVIRKAARRAVKSTE